MKYKDTYEILIRKKVPYWSEFLIGLMIVLFSFLLLLYFVMIPSDDASGEMKVAYYILVVPEWLKVGSAYSFLGLILLFPIYSISKSFKPAILMINHDNIKICSKAGEKVFPVESLRKILLNDVRSLLGKERTEIIIKQSEHKSTSFLLKYYIQTEELLEALSIYEKVDFVFYNEIAIETHDEV